MKDLLTSLRASNETYNSMKHSARAIIRRAEIPLLAVIVLYKAATNLLFVPLMQQLWSLTLRFAPMHYLSNNNASDIFSSPAIILCITLIAILTAFWALYEFSVLLHGLDLARKGETIRLPALLRTSLADIRHAFLPQNWLVLVYSAVLIPFTNFSSPITISRSLPCRNTSWVSSGQTAGITCSIWLPVLPCCSSMSAGCWCCRCSCWSAKACGSR